VHLNAGLGKSDLPFFGFTVLLLINTEKKEETVSRLARKDSIRRIFRALLTNFLGFN